MHPKHISIYILAATKTALVCYPCIFFLPVRCQSKKKIIEQQPDTIPFSAVWLWGVDLMGPRFG